MSDLCKAQPNEKQSVPGEADIVWLRPSWLLAPTMMNCSPDLTYALRTTHYATCAFAFLLYVPSLIAKNEMDPRDITFLTTDGTIALSHEGSTIPFGVVVFMTAPAVILVGLCEWYRLKSFSRGKALRNAFTLGLDIIAACLYTFSVTETVKLATGILRPDFLARCAPQQVTATTTYVCTGDSSTVKAGRSAFPSGHTSQAFALSVYTTLYLIWLLYIRRQDDSPNDDEDHSHPDCRSAACFQLQELARVLCVLAPLGFAFTVGLSRIRDNLHHPDDVLAGMVIGSVFASVLFVRSCLTLMIKGPDGSSHVVKNGVQMASQDFTEQM